MSYATPVWRAVSPLLITAVLAASVSGCASDLTEIVVVVETDLPTQIDDVNIVATDGAGVSHTSSTTVGGIDDARFPLTLGIQAGDNKQGSVQVNVEAHLSDTTTLNAEAVTHFVEGRRLVLRIMLAQACIDTGAIDCGTGMTCTAASGYRCGSSAVDPATLPLWNGSLLFEDADAGHLDAGISSDAGSDMTMAADGARRLDLGMPFSCIADSACSATVTFPECDVSYCDLTSHQCIYQSLNCDDSDPCTTDTCTSGHNGSCGHAPGCI